MTPLVVWEKSFKQEIKTRLADPDFILMFKITAVTLTGQSKDKITFLQLRYLKIKKTEGIYEIHSVSREVMFEMQIKNYQVFTILFEQTSCLILVSAG